MKFLLIAALCLSIYSVNATLPLNEALQALRARLELQTIEGLWSVHRNGDYEVCLFTNELNGPLGAAALKAIESDPEYAALKSDLIAKGVAFQEFIDALLTGIGFFSPPVTCRPATMIGGVPELMREIRATWEHILIEDELADLKSRSSEFAAFHTSLAGRQAMFHRIRCTADVQAVVSLMVRDGVDVAYILGLFARIFSWSSVAGC